jgi:hypothetical protein
MRRKRGYLSGSAASQKHGPCWCGAALRLTQEDASGSDSHAFEWTNHDAEKKRARPSLPKRTNSYFLSI